MKKISILLITASITFFSFNVAANTLIKTKLSEELALAKSQYEMVVKSGFAWTTTASLLKKAKSAIEKGELLVASKLISKAMIETNGSLKQAELSKQNQ